ncbi:MAG: HNH endonuclease [Deltaproteobacteria bacterium]|nr:HNH endonuclease [Deltaproteobacteria bacterium]
MPRSKGGSDDIGNLQTLCKKCNIGKSNKDTTDLRKNEVNADRENGEMVKIKKSDGRRLCCMRGLHP